MILPIVSFGNSILRCKCSPVQENQPIEDILKNMYETMYNAQGVGLAAPQVGLDLSIFIIDTTPFCDDENNLIPLKKEFILCAKHHFNYLLNFIENKKAIPRGWLLSFT